MAKSAAKKSVSSKKAAPEKTEVTKKKSASVKPSSEEKATPDSTEKEATPAKKAATAKKTAATKKTASAKKAAPAKESAPAKKAAATEKKAAATEKKATSVKKDTPAKEATPAAEEVIPAQDSPAEKKEAAAKKASPAKKPAPEKKAAPVKKAPVKKRISAKRRPSLPQLAGLPTGLSSNQPKEKPKKLSAAFLKAQHQHLLDLRDSLIDQMSNVVRDTLGRGDDRAESSAFGMHQADAGSDAYDREFALNILSKEQNALYEIEEAIERIKRGDYGICQGSGEQIPQARLEAIPFARCTVEYQEKLDEEQAAGNFRTPVTSLFGLEEKDLSKSSDEDDD